MKKLTVAWLSAGVSSFIAAYLIRDEIDEFYYIDIDDQHPDSMRFIKDCESALGRPIKILKSNYGSVENAILAQGCVRIAKTGFAPCTAYLKRRVRKEQFELLHQNDEITYVWGFDSTKHEQSRADRIVEAMPQYNHRFPLIEQGLTNKGRAPFQPDMPRLEDIWHFPKVAGKEQIHQNQKPTNLLSQIINQHTKEGDLILDPFAGSCSTAVAAYRLKRDYIGFEIDPVEYAAGTKWLDAVRSQMSIFDFM